MRHVSKSQSPRTTIIPKGIATRIINKCRNQTMNTRKGELLTYLKSQFILDALTPHIKSDSHWPQGSCSQKCVYSRNRHNACTLHPFSSPQHHPIDIYICTDSYMCKEKSEGSPLKHRAPPASCFASWKQIFCDTDILRNPCPFSLRACGSCLASETNKWPWDHLSFLTPNGAELWIPNSFNPCVLLSNKVGLPK